MDQETEVALLKQEIGFLKTEVNSIKEDVKTKFDRLEQKLDQALKGRPTWAVTIIITVLTTTSAGLVVAFLARK